MARLLFRGWLALLEGHLTRSTTTPQDADPREVLRHLVHAGSTFKSCCNKQDCYPTEVRIVAAASFQAQGQIHRLRPRRWSATEADGAAITCARRRPRPCPIRPTPCSASAGPVPDTPWLCAVPRRL